MTLGDHGADDGGSRKIFRSAIQGYSARMYGRSVPLAIFVALVPDTALCEPKLMEPPIYLAYGGTISSGKHGFIYSMSYFTEEQVNDARWEALRRKRARWNYCNPAVPKMLRRDVRWFEPAAPGAKRCATVVYTMQCPMPKTFRSPPGDEFAKERAAMLSEPYPDGPPEPSCGEKNGFVLHARSYGKGKTSGGLRFGWFSMPPDFTGDEPSFVPLTTRSKADAVGRKFVSAQSRSGSAHPQ